MVHDIPGCYGSRTAPPIQEEAALGEGKVTRVVGDERTSETHCGKAILKHSICVHDVLTIISRRWGIKIYKPVCGGRGGGVSRACGDIDIKL